MSKAKPRITIVGLGLIGGSIGLALRAADVASEVIGHDKEPGKSALAKKKGAVDKTHWNLVSACEQADLVILATPFGAIEETLTAIGPELRPSCVVMDTVTLKEPVLELASETLPQEVFFVGGNPIVGQAVEGQGGLEAARADLFQKGIFCLVPSMTADPAAVKLTADLVTILGAKPLFLDAAEHDGLIGASEFLPTLLASTLLATVTGQPSWREIRKMAGASFEIGTQLASTAPSGLGDACIANRDNLLRWLDGFSTSLAGLRQDLVDGEVEAIEQKLETAVEERTLWLRDRAEGQWEGIQGPPMPEKTGMLQDVFLGGLMRKRPKKEE